MPIILCKKIAFIKGTYRLFGKNHRLATLSTLFK